jgi:sugar lactone lactonase YvrE
VEVNLKNGKVKQKIKVDGARFLNDVAANSESVYVSDTLGNKIYKYNGKTIAPLATKGSLESPNGLLLADGKLYVASWGDVRDFSQTPKQAGRLYSLNLDGSNKEILSKSFGNLDGLEKVNDTFIISDWSAGKLYKIVAKGKPELISEGAQGYADLTLTGDTEKKTIVLPLMMENKVVAIEL